MWTIKSFKCFSLLVKSPIISYWLKIMCITNFDFDTYLLIMRKETIHFVSHQIVSWQFSLYLHTNWWWLRMYLLSTQIYNVTWCSPVYSETNTGKGDRESRMPGPHGTNPTTTTINRENDKIKHEKESEMAK